MLTGLAWLGTREFGHESLGEPLAYSGDNMVNFAREQKRDAISSNNLPRISIA